MLKLLQKSKLAGHDEELLKYCYADTSGAEILAMIETRNFDKLPGPDP